MDCCSHDLLPRMNRWTTNRWETAVLPLLREEREDGRSSTVEERVIGAGLQALEKNEDGPAVKKLFAAFAVTQVSRLSGVISDMCSLVYDLRRRTLCIR